MAGSQAVLRQPNDREDDHGEESEKGEKVGVKGEEDEEGGWAQRRKDRQESSGAQRRRQEGEQG
jgi:hypothetical protein